MSSSGSDDDCYGNVAQKLQKLKELYKQDTKLTSCVSLLDESNELEEIVKINLANIKTNPVSLDSYTENPSSLTHNNIPVKNKTLNAQAAIIQETSEQHPEPTRLRRRGKKVNYNDAYTPEQILEAIAPRKRSKRANTSSVPSDNSVTRRTRRGGSRQTVSNCIPVISIGNTCDYPDSCETQQLFSSATRRQSDDVVLIDDEASKSINDDNEELSVKVYWCSCDIYKFTIRRYQKLTQIFDYFSERENVNNDKLLLIYNDRILKPDDTPESIGYNIAKFIDGGIVKQSLVRKPDKLGVLHSDQIKIKFQYLNMKRPFEAMVGVDERLHIAMVKCAEHLDRPLDSLKFFFDGDCVSCSQTPGELQFEGGECIDVNY